MITKTKYMTLIFSLVMGASLSGADHLRAVRTDVARSPLAYVGVGAFATAAIVYKDSPLKLAMLGVLTAGYHASVLPHWWNLGTELNNLQINRATGSLLKRKVWGGTRDFTTGYAIKSHYDGLPDDSSKRHFAQQLEQEIVKGDTFFTALDELKSNFIRYEKSSSILLKFAAAAGYTGANPQENFLEGSYLVDNDIDVTLRPVFNENMAGSIISKSFSLDWRWSPFLGMAVPSWYTWSYTKASECIWETLHQYARIRAIHKIIELHIPKSDTLTVILRPDVQGM